MKSNFVGWVHQIRSGNLLSAASSCDILQMCVALEREPPAHIIAAAGGIDSVEVKLMAVASDIDQVDVHGDSALHLVLKQLDVLRDYYSPSSSSISGQRSLNVEAIQKTVAEAVMMLIGAGATIAEPNSSGKLPLHIAAEFLSDSVISALLSAKVFI
jgi:ankyrin repeat protein